MNDHNNILNYSDSEGEDIIAGSFSQETPKPISVDSKFKIQQLDRHLKALENPKKNKTWCNICNKELKSAIHAKTHYNSVGHKTNFSQLREKRIVNILFPAMAQAKSHCKICDLNVLGNILINGHLNTEAHKRNAEAYCTVCEIRTISKDALWEHEHFSSTHYQKVKALQGDSLQENSPSNSCEFHCEVPVARAIADFNISRACVSPTMPSEILLKNTSNIFDECLVKTSMVNELSPKKWNNYCNICDIHYLPDQLYDHTNQFPHSVIDMLNTQYSSETVNAFCAVTNGKYLVCKLCNITMKGLGDVKSHLNGIKHIKKFRSKFIEDSSNNSQDNGTDSIQRQVNDTSICDKSVKDLLKEVVDTKVVPLNTEEFYCYLCKSDFKSKIGLNIHTISFPHVEMAKWKAEIVSLGVPYAEYWVHTKTSLTCTLCEFQANSAAASRSHMNETMHKTLLTEWCKEFTLWKFGDLVDPKYFYCTACDLRLPGTSDADSHYNTNTHSKRLELYCKPCRVSNSSEKMLLEHQMSKEHREEMFKETVDKINTTNKHIKEEKNEEASSPDSKSEAIEAQIFCQVEKLVQTLYFSKTVPFDVALDYLKKINTQVAELEGMYESKSETSSSSTNSSQSTSNKREQIVSSLNPSNDAEYKLESFIENNHTGEGILRVTIEEARNETKDTKKGKTAPKNKVTFLKETDFPKMYQDINKLKQQLTEPSLEREVLDQIKTLIRVVNTTKVPLEKVLELLNNFHTDLDCAVLKFKDKNRWDI